MERNKRIVWIASGVLVGLGVLSLVLNFGFGLAVNIAWPLALMMLGAGFSGLAVFLTSRWSWFDLLYIPGSLLIALGLVFLVNMLTGDWNAWAYAWFLVVVGAGAGIVLTSRSRHWPPVLNLIGASLIVGGITLFVLFGAIAGGRFIQVAAPVLLLAGGLGLRWVRLETILPEGFLRRPQPLQAAAAEAAAPPVDQKALVEPLSGRELEVLRLIDQGLSNPEIAEKLSVAPSTIKTHINNIYGKLGVQTRIQAIKHARELGLI